MLIEAFLPEPAVEGLDIGVVGRLPRTREVQRDVVPIGPEIDVFRDELRPLVNPDRPRPSMLLRDPFQNLYNLQAANPLAHMNRQAFTGMIVHYR